MIQVIPRDQIFDLSQSRFVLIRSENSSTLVFDLFPAQNKESVVLGLASLEVIASQAPESAVVVSRSSIDTKSVVPVSTQIGSKRSSIGPSMPPQEVLGAYRVQKPRLIDRKFASEDTGSTIVLYQNNSPGNNLDIESQSMLVSLEPDSSSFSKSQAIGFIERSLFSRKCVPVKIALRDFTLEQQSMFITVKCRESQRVISNQQVSVTNLEILDQEQLDFKVDCLRHTRIDKGLVQFTSYLNRRSPGSSVFFTSRVWSNSVSSSEILRSFQRVDQSSKSASLQVVCTQNQYAEVIAQAFDAKNRPCGYPVRTLVRPKNSHLDIQSIVLTSLDSNGLSASIFGIPEGTEAVRIDRRNVSNLALPTETLGTFPVALGFLGFTDKNITESNYPSTETVFEYSVFLITRGMQRVSDHKLRIEYGLIDNSYSFQSSFTEVDGKIQVQITPEKPRDLLDSLSRSLADKSLDSVFSDQIKEIRSQTSESFLYDVYSVNTETSEQSYIDEFSENRFSLPYRENTIYYVYPKTSTPRKQISSIKKLVLEPQLVSRSRGSRVSPRNLASNLDSQIIVDDGIKPRLFNPRALIDGTISDRDASLTSYPTGQIISYQVPTRRAPRTAGGLTCRRIYRERNLIQWNISSLSDVSHFLLKASLGQDSQNTLDLCTVQKTQATRYSFIDDVLGKSPGFIRYYLTPVDSKGVNQTTISVDLQPGEVEIG